MGRIPTQAVQRADKRKPITAKIVDYSNMAPAWRFYHFDIQNKWGLSSLFGSFVFSYDEQLFEKVCDEEDDELNKILEECNKKYFAGVDSFIKTIAEKYSKKISPKVLRCLCKQLSESYFSKVIYPVLRSYERMSWAEIERARHGYNGKSKNHPVKVSDFIKEARDRLSELHIDDEQLYSLRINGTCRIYGLRELNVLEIIWVDQNHEICPSSRE